MSRFQPAPVRGRDGARLKADGGAGSPASSFAVVSLSSVCCRRPFRRNRRHCHAAVPATCPRSCPHRGCAAALGRRARPVARPGRDAGVHAVGTLQPSASHCQVVRGPARCTRRARAAQGHFAAQPPSGKAQMPPSSFAGILAHCCSCHRLPARAGLAPVGRSPAASRPQPTVIIGCCPPPPVPAPLGGTARASLLPKPPALPPATTRAAGCRWRFGLLTPLLPC